MSSLSGEVSEGRSKEDGAMVLEHSNRGKAWAQLKIGVWCLDAAHAKQYGLSFDEKKGWKLIKKAADQGDPSALYLMATECGDEEMNKLHYLKRAADLGFPTAQHDLAVIYNVNEDKEKFLHYMTLAASQGYSKSCASLGYMFMYAICGLSQSYILTKHYTGKNLEDAYSVCCSSFSSLVLVNERYEGIFEIPGHSPIPMFLFWGRRALEGDLPVEAEDELTNNISMIEDQQKNLCANCRKEAESSSFKRCMQCLGAWYCGKECQVQHWKAGHKIDCVSINRNK